MKVSFIHLSAIIAIVLLMFRYFDLNLGGGIFSLDVHPDGKKLATAGQDQKGIGLLIIWDIDFVADDSSKILDDSNINFGFLARISHPGILIIHHALETNNQL